MSGEAKHTPGPWTVAESFTPGYRKCPAIQANEPKSGEMFELCVIFGEDDDAVATPMAQANARLIAAAPETAAERDRLREVNADMLAALKGLRPIIEAAESNASGNLEWPRVSARINAARAAIAKAEALR